MARSVAFRIEKVEPPGYSARPDLHVEFWRAVVAIGLTVKDRELSEGLDAYGAPLKAIAPSTRAHRHSAMGPADPNAPPLTPAYGLSRTRSLLTGRAHAREHYALFYWKTDQVTGRHWGEILGYHRAGKGHLPRRDVIGLSPAGLAEVRRKAQEWWDARVRHVIPPPAVAKVPTPANAVLIKSHRYKPKSPARAVPKANRRIGRLEINGNQYTLAGGSETEIRRAVGGAPTSGFSGFKRRAYDEQGNLTELGKKARSYFKRPEPPKRPPAKPTPQPPTPPPSRPPEPPVVQHAGKPGPAGEAIPPRPAPPTPRPVVAPAGVTTPPEPFLQEARDIDAHVRPTVERLAQRHGITPDEYVVRAEHVLKEVVDAAELVIRTRHHNVRDILADGRFKSQFETGTSRGLLSPKRREHVEELSMGLPKSTPPEQRPVYGLLATPGPDGPSGPGYRAARPYGEVAWRLKESVRERTRITFGDSLNNIRLVQSSPADAPALRSTWGLRRDPPEDLVSIRERKSAVELLEYLSREYTYVETQYMGGLRLEDVAEVVFEVQPPAEIITALESRGIPWRVVPNR